MEFLQETFDSVVATGQAIFENVYLSGAGLMTADGFLSNSAGLIAIACALVAVFFLWHKFRQYVEELYYTDQQILAEIAAADDDDESPKKSPRKSSPKASPKGSPKTPMVTAMKSAMKSVTASMKKRSSKSPATTPKATTPKATPKSAMKSMKKK